MNKSGLALPSFSHFWLDFFPFFFSRTNIIISVATASMSIDLFTSREWIESEFEEIGLKIRNRKKNHWSNRGCNNDSIVIHHGVCEKSSVHKYNYNGHIQLIGFHELWRCSVNAIRRVSSTQEPPFADLSLLWFRGRCTALIYEANRSKVDLESIYFRKKNIVLPF